MPPLAPQPRIRLSFRSGPLAVRETLARILAELEALGIGAEDLGTAEIVLAEVLNNIVEHAYPETGTRGPVHVACRVGPDGLHVRIVDHGRAMPGGVLPSARAVEPPRDPSDLPEGGFGWPLILELARDVQYRRSEGRNVLKLRLPISRACA